MALRLIHVAAYIRSPFLFKANNIPSDVYNPEGGHSSVVHSSADGRWFMAIFLAIVTNAA